MQEQTRRLEHIGFVTADPEDLRGNVKCGRHMPGQRVQRLTTERVTERLGLRNGAVVPIDEPGTQRCAAAVDGDHRRALSCQPDGMNRVTASQLPDERAERGER